jgi:hypothetical protein
MPVGRLRVKAYPIHNGSSSNLRSEKFGFQSTAFFDKRSHLRSQCFNLRVDFCDPALHIG